MMHNIKLEFGNTSSKGPISKRKKIEQSFSLFRCAEAGDGRSSKALESVDKRWKFIRAGPMHLAAVFYFQLLYFGYIVSPKFVDFNFTAGSWQSTSTAL